MNPTATLPWDELDKAEEALEEERRHGTSYDKLKAAEERYDQVRDNLYRFAAMVFSAAVAAYGGKDQVVPIAGYVPEKVWKQLAQRLGFDIAISIAQKAIRRVYSAEDEIGRLKARVRELEDLIANHLPGIGDPGTVPPRPTALSNGTTTHTQE